MSDFDKDYFERGLQTGKSAYENYRWIPEMTIPFAYELIRHLEIKRSDNILDFGTAKGYLVKAFRLLHYKAYGTDISQYALKEAPLDVKPYLYDWNQYPKLYKQQAWINPGWNWIIAKDVFEHIEKDKLEKLLKVLQPLTKNMFVIVPLGEDGKYNAPINDLDPTHVICEDFQWWCDLFNRTGFKVDDLRNEIPYMKQTYKGIINAHAFFKLKAK